MLPSARRRSELVKPNDRLTATERLNIYHRQYWYRILDSFNEDFPGLRAVLGERAFERLARAYLSDCPSQSFTLRNLGSRLEAWLGEHSEFAGKNLALALDMVRLEWAHIEAFDNAERKALGPEDLLELGPELALALQPYVGLLDLQYPVDDLRVKANANQEEHNRASNAVSAPARRHLVRRYAQAEAETDFPGGASRGVHRLLPQAGGRRVSFASSYRARPGYRSRTRDGSGLGPSTGPGLVWELGATRLALCKRYKSCMKCLCARHPAWSRRFC